LGASLPGRRSCSKQRQRLAQTGRQATTLQTSSSSQRAGSSGSGSSSSRVRSAAREACRTRVCHHWCRSSAWRHRCRSSIKGSSGRGIRGIMKRQRSAAAPAAASPATGTTRHLNSGGGPALRLKQPRLDAHASERWRSLQCCLMQAGPQQRHLATVSDVRLYSGLGSGWKCASLHLSLYFAS
jgi:hypothetical protein